MRSARQLISTVVLQEGLKYLERDPVEHLPLLLNWADRLAINEGHRKNLQNIRGFIQDPRNNWNQLIRRILTEVNPQMQRKLLINFFVNSGLIGCPIIEQNRERYGCNIPWAILVDPTAACNLDCTGCWAAEYGKTASLSREVLDRIIREGKQLGIHMYIYSGGEPLVRKDDLISLAERHDDCAFLAFTNATLVDEPFARELERVGNFALAISVEGFEDETDLRRGEGTYRKVVRAMEILKAHGLGFGFSTCYHSKNAEVVGSEAYVDRMIEAGALFGWYFTYMPLGRHAVPGLLATAEQREFMYHQIRSFRETKPIFLLDFWNDGEFVGGCIAGGRSYLHINASGDVEPCAFIHYANANIHEVSLLDALRSPLLMEYRKHQPFNANHLRPCPLLDNPDMLRRMVHESRAQSTQAVDEESVDELAAKCEEAARDWAPVADQLMTKSKTRLA